MTGGTDSIGESGQGYSTLVLAVVAVQVDGPDILSCAL